MIRGIFTLPLSAMDVSFRRDRHESSIGGQPYVAGPENALLRVFFDALSAESPAYNPITLCGPSGTGKSHLLNGSVNHFKVHATQRRVHFSSGADFARMYARAIELDSLAELRERFAAADVFIIDGLHEFAGKRGAQQELLGTLDRSQDREVLWLFSCSSPVSDWSWMLPGLQSRLTNGLIIPLVPPQESTRVEIVRRLADDKGIPLTDERIAGLAASRSHPFGSSISFPHLHGLVMQLAHDLGESNRLENSVSRNAGTDVIEPPGGPDRSARNIAKLVAQQFDLKLADLLGASRRRSVVRARGVAMYLARSLLELSYEQLGREFGGRDHTTALHAYRKVVNSLATDHLLKQTVEKLASQLAMRTTTTV